MHRLTRLLTVGHALLLAGAVVVVLLTVTYAVVVRQADSTVGGCMDANAKWLATARKDVRDAAGERVLALDADATDLERRQHQQRADAALHATSEILIRISRPVALLTQDAHGAPVFATPSVAARLSYCRERFPRPWPLS